jgi:hypothetical protein
MFAAFCLLFCLALVAAAPAARAAEPAPSRTVGFTLMPSSQTGIVFTNVLSDARAAENQIRMNGSGVALGDVDGDGLCDIYLCRLEGGNVLYHNLGNWRFEDITAAAGVVCEGQYSTGAVFADVDGDGHLDLLVNGIGTGTRLFMNNGKGVFTERADSGLIRRFGATTLTLADIDGDGDLDLYVANYRTTTIRSTGFASLRLGNKRMALPEDRDHIEFTPEGRVLEHGEPDVLYLNDGTGHFTPVSWTDGRFLDEDGKPLTKPPFDWGLTAAFRDLNGDGFPDLYVCNDFHSSDKIWINDGHGRFRALPRLALRHTSTFAMAIDFGDINRDGWDDLIEADMLSRQHPRRLMQFAATDPYFPQIGETENRPQVDRNTLQLNRGDGTYAEIAYYSGLEASDWSWSILLLDVDLDGYEDLLCATGQLFDTQDLDADARIQAKGPWRRDLIPQKLLMFPRLAQHKVAFRNRGDLTFEEVSQRWGFDQLVIGQGMALADLDNDGDLDLVVNNLNGAVGVYRNASTAPRLAVRLHGLPPNTSGIGARIRVLGGPVEQAQEMMAGGRYLSGDDKLRVFAAGSETHQLRVEVRWRSGKVTSVDRAQPNRVYELFESGQAPVISGPLLAEVRGQTAEVGSQRTAMSKRPLISSESHPASTSAKSGGPMFKDESAVLDHRHHDEPFDDFQRQPLLPRKLSQLGPGVAWFDIDSDGWDDIIIASGKGGPLAIFRNDGHGGFDRLHQPTLDSPVAQDQTDVLGLANGSGARFILAGSSNYESGSSNAPVATAYPITPNASIASFPGQLASTGPLALGDLRGDGHLALFVGGRCLPGRWPEPADSLLFVDRGVGFQLDPTLSAAFRKVGLVSGAVFADVNGDGAPDLVLACEWGPLRLFVNHAGHFEEETKAWGLDQYQGWWNGVAVGDFDNDGRLDLVASNWGLNSLYQNATGQRRLELALKSPESSSPPNDPTLRLPLLYYGDFDSNGVLDLIEAEYAPDLGKVAPIKSRAALARGVPLLADKFRSYAEYNEADIDAVLGKRLPNPARLDANWLASTVFLNRGDHFEARMLPAEAQFAPAYGVVVADFDGDGNEDLFLTQNLFALEPTTARIDAGRGLLLRGDGHGRFAAVPGQESGIMMYGEGRGAAAADYDGDGRVDLLAAQNGGETKLYHNTLATPGLRVRLQGQPGNPNALGAVVRLGKEGHWGAARLVEGGGGYWSQDSPVQVMAKSAGAKDIQIRWPGGKLTVSEIPDGATEIVVRPDGRIVRVR